MADCKICATPTELKYCSDTCRRIAKKAQNKLSHERNYIPIARNCVTCGEKLKKDLQKYCSAECGSQLKNREVAMNKLIQKFLCTYRKSNLVTPVYYG